ncbi:MAG: acyl-CoA dehydrogenase family protein [Sphingomonadales bacterium]|nr:acyl-CoA dehydrogenase family protein [Sphingomonadales bacterium]
MIALDAWRAQARAWLASVAPRFGKEAARGLAPEAHLALGRAYQRAKFEAGFAGINWAPEWHGQGLTPLHKVVFEEEEMPFGMPMGYFGVSLGISVPVVMQMAQDRDWARERVLAALRGDEIWCQLFSEPSGGSDLAGLRTRAEPDGNQWRLNGQKLWTTWAQHSDYGVIVARHDPALPKHKGLTYFWLDMHAPGVTVRPFRLATGDAHVNEVFLDEVRIDDTQRLSPVGGGFAAAMATLMIERYSAADPAGFGPPLEAFVALARVRTIGGRPALDDGRIRSVIARTYAMRSGLDAIRTRAMRMMEAGMEPGPEGALSKLVSVRSRQRLSELAIDLSGALGLAWDQGAWVKDDWVQSWLSAPTMRIAGGADEMLLNTIAERILGLPQDHRPDKGIAFRDVPV